MSRETREWLNRMVLVGNVEARKGQPVMGWDPAESQLVDGRAWHHDESLQGDEPNHYPGLIPVADVERRLFNWEVCPGDLRTTYMGPSGVGTMVDQTRQTMVRPPGALGPDDPGAVMGVFKKGYKPHQYRQWLITNVSHILDDELGVGGAGLLAQGARAYVQVTVPETITTPEGVEFLPNLLAATSFDGSLSSTYLLCVTNVVCDNTMSAALMEGAASGRRYKVKHSVNSLERITDIREALQIAHGITDDFSTQVAQLCDVAVSEGDWAQFREAIAPTEGKPDGSSKTQAVTKQEALDNLWRNDKRVAPWQGSAWGVVQAVNTYTHHIATVRNVSRDERNMDRAVTGGVDKLDGGTLATLEEVFAAS